MNVTTINGCLWNSNLTLNISVEALEWNHLVCMPYVFITLLCLIDAVGFLTLFCLKTPTKNYYETQKEQPETCITVRAKITVVICFFLYAHHKIHIVQAWNITFTMWPFSAI